MYAKYKLKDLLADAYFNGMHHAIMKCTKLMLHYIQITSNCVSQIILIKFRFLNKFRFKSISEPIIYLHSSRSIHIHYKQAKERLYSEESKQI